NALLAPVVHLPDLVIGRNTQPRDGADEFLFLQVILPQELYRGFLVVNVQEKSSVRSEKHLRAGDPYTFQYIQGFGLPGIDERSLLQQRFQRVADVLNGYPEDTERLTGIPDPGLQVGGS